MLVYAGNKAAAAQASAEVFDATTPLAVSFDDAANQAADRNGTLPATSAITPETNGLLVGGARVAGPVISWPAGAPMQVSAGGATTLSLWVRPENIAAGRLLAWGPVQLSVQGGRVNASVAAVSLVGGTSSVLAGSNWLGCRSAAQVQPVRTRRTPTVRGMPPEPWHCAT